jgi:MoaA/NifB/PqqE/SkfB family radical SAM enzyme
MQFTRVLADPEFERYFAGLKQVFLYITDDCNLRCIHCLYKPWLRAGSEMDSDTTLALLKKFRELGAVKLSLLGGEPTLYGRSAANLQLPEIVARANAIGYQYVRLVTNGVFDETLLLDERLRSLSEITFSLDGDRPDINDCLRGKGSFERSVQNMQRAISLGYRVDLTSCVHKGNVGRDENGERIIDRSIHWATSLGVSRINFHPLFKMGTARDSWTEETDILPLEWVSLYSEIRANIDKGKYAIPVRIPMRFVTQQQFSEDPGYYSFCPVKNGDRVLVHANGLIQICALMNGVPISVARFSSSSQSVRIIWENLRNELQEFKFTAGEDHPCPVMLNNFGSLVPLCISFKPRQDEFIWKKMGLP